MKQIITQKNKPAEFDGERAMLYERAMTNYPSARKMDMGVMKKVLNPEKNDKILGFGEGNGFFCNAVANAVGTSGEYLITDPSESQLENLKRRVNLPQIRVKVAGAEGLDTEKNYYDKVWSFGAFHHCPQQAQAMKKIYSALKSGGKMVICDVFQGSALARHFDIQVARYCCTGHEVKFMSEEFAKSLCVLAGFKEENVKIVDLPQKWVFDSEEDIGKFMHDLHAMTLLDGTEDERMQKTLEGCKKILGVEKKNGKYELNWPMKAVVAVK